jgi:hypothetical protein
VPGIAPPAEPEEVTRAVAEIRAAAPPALPPPPPPPGPGLESDELTEPLIDRAERFAEGDLSELEKLTSQDIADVFDFLFGLAADWRGPHWELTPRESTRLGKWVKRAIDRHGWAWIAKYLPDAMALGLVCYEAGRRLRIEAKLVQERKEAEAKDAKKLELVES